MQLLTLTNINKLTKKELKQAIQDCFEYAPEATPIDRLAILQEAQFYTQELERRHDSWTSIRDLILEIFVILLIGAEIYMSIRAERLQKANFAEEKQVFDNLEKSSGATASSLIAVQGNLENMSVVLQKQLSLSYEVAVAVTFDTNTKRVVLANNGRTNVYIWGDRLGDHQRMMEQAPRMITPGGSYYIGAESLYDEIGIKLPKSSSGTIPFQVFLKNDAGQRFVLDARFFTVWYNDLLTIHTQTTAVRQENW